jgi:hypothetical protein
VKFEEMLNVLKETNKKRKNRVPEGVLKEILALVIENPLENDRMLCQSQIEMVLTQRNGGKSK